MSTFTALLEQVNRVPGVRGAMIVASEDGLIVEADVMIGVAGATVAALVASLFRRARRAMLGAQLGSVSFLQLDAEHGLLFAAAPPQLGDLLLVVVADSYVNVGLVRLEAAGIAEALG